MGIDVFVVYTTRDSPLNCHHLDINSAITARDLCFLFPVLNFELSLS
jgi:hypothetical protein